MGMGGHRRAKAQPADCWRIRTKEHPEYIAVRSGISSSNLWTHAEGGLAGNRNVGYGHEDRFNRNTLRILIIYYGARQPYLSIGWIRDYADDRRFNHQSVMVGSK